MKKFILLVITLSSLFVNPAFADSNTNVSPIKYEQSDIKIIINNEELMLKQKPVIINGRTMVPLRAIFDALGLTIDWNQEQQTITTKTDLDIITFTIGKNLVTKNQEMLIMDTYPTIINGSTMVPLRFLSELFYAEVNWNPYSRMIQITTADRLPNSDYKNYGDKKIGATITEVVDGDTMKAIIDGKKETIRLIMVDTPEIKHTSKSEQPYGKDAYKFVKDRLENRDVQLEFDEKIRDRYGRLMAYVWLGDDLFNAYILEKGLGRLSDPIGLNSKYFSQLAKAKDKARQSVSGIWSIENYVKDDGFEKITLKPEITEPITYKVDKHIQSGPIKMHISNVTLDPSYKLSEYFQERITAIVIDVKVENTSSDVIIWHPEKGTIQLNTNDQIKSLSYMHNAVGGEFNGVKTVEGKIIFEVIGSLSKIENLNYFIKGAQDAGYSKKGEDVNIEIPLKP